jgi:flavin-dependent dehydrogenase
LAAIAALREGARVHIVERSQFPKHKVCGEFLSPEIAPVLARAGVLDAFLDCQPFRVRRMSLHFGLREKHAVLPEPAYGLSRYTFDHLLWSTAEALGAQRSEDASNPAIVACGRPPGSDSKGTRLFGFKAHFEGPVDDAVELYFLGRAYVGINCIEQGRTNVCGLAPESLLNAHGFNPESLMEAGPALRSRLKPLHRVMKWIFTGPLEYAQRWDRNDVYLAGDALSFVDPFTGSGLLCAAVTGSLAGVHAARRVPVEDHLRICRASIAKPFLFSSVLRSIAATEWAERLVGFVPGEWLFHLTRPRA